MIRGFGPDGVGSSGTLTEDVKYADEHESFCRKFCKEFGVEADHHESVAEGPGDEPGRTIPQNQMSKHQTEVQKAGSERVEKARKLLSACGYQCVNGGKGPNSTVARNKERR